MNFFAPFIFTVMKCVIQRVKYATLEVDGNKISEIGKGLVVFFGVGVGDKEEYCDKMVKKIVNMRIFEDENGKMNLSVKDIGGEILLVSQFTLYADTSKGNRPSFSFAEEPERANMLYELALEKVSESGVAVKKGVFGADMKILQLNDGPVTIIHEVGDGK